MEQSLNNPVVQLKRIVDIACKQGTNVPMKAIWLNVISDLGIKPSPTESDDEILIKDFLTDVDELAGKAMLILESLEGYDQKIFKNAIFNVRRSIFSYSPNEQWGPSKAILDPATLVALSLGSSAITTKSIDLEIEGKNLEQIITDIEDLSNSIRKSKINPELKNLLMIRIEDIRLAVNSYWLNGTEGLRKAAELNLGFIIANAEEVSKSKGEDRKVWEKVINIISFIFDVANIGTTIFQITGGDLTKLLPPTT